MQSVRDTDVRFLDWMLEHSAPLPAPHRGKGAKATWGPSALFFRLPVNPPLFQKSHKGKEAVSEDGAPDVYAGWEEAAKGYLPA